MITLGIHDGHTATACVIKDGKVVACISEERLNRQKEWGGFPKRAILECLKIAKIRPNDINGVGIAGLLGPTLPANYYDPPISKKISYFASIILPKKFLQSNYWVKPTRKVLSYFRNRREIKANLKSLGINVEPVFYEHHFLHAVTAHFFSWYGIENNLIITCDGSGDLVCATVNIGRGFEIERIAEISTYNSIGEFYTQITQYLGMKPMSHEYKVMGLAPYAKNEFAEKTLKLVENFFTVENNSPLIFKNNSGYWKWRYLKAFRKIFIGHRFDNIAKAAQILIERIIPQWIKNAIIYTGINTVALSGGVFMNVKANNVVLNLPEVRNLFIFPSCGDESLAIGAAIIRSIELGNKKIEPLGPIYFGPAYDIAKIEEEIFSLKEKFRIERIENIEEFIGKEISKGKVIARFSGRMEWGARALGNRSILADPRNKEVIKRINEAIKNRDFWMPFAPSILEERAEEYLVNPKDFFAPYMIMAFPTKKKAQEDLIAALHPYDYTARPQVVRESWNPSYYKIIKSFEKETGVGALLNTSFNLHGDPIVCSPRDAIYTFINSELDGLALENYYVTRE